jgi:hypothetical protein
MAMTAYRPLVLSCMAPCRYFLAIAEGFLLKAAAADGAFRLRSRM